MGSGEPPLLEDFPFVEMDHLSRSQRLPLPAHPKPDPQPIQPELKLWKCECGAENPYEEANCKECKQQSPHLCLICWCHTDPNDVENTIRWPCMHLFHAACANPWLQMENTCPECKHAMDDHGGFDDFDDYDHPDHL